MSLPPLPDNAIVLGAQARDWRDAVTIAGEALTRSGSARAAYTGEMIRMIEDNGPYVVVEKGLALAHARPGPEVLADGLAVVTLAEPVRFGHPHNDPVSVVLGLATARTEDHLEAVAAVANVFNAPGATERLAAATTLDEVRAFFAV